MELLFVLFVLVVCFLNIVLFFKIWKMTNTVEKIFQLSLTKSGYKMKESWEEDELEIVFVKKDD